MKDDKHFLNKLVFLYPTRLGKLYCASVDAVSRLYRCRKVRHGRFHALESVGCPLPVVGDQEKNIA